MARVAACTRLGQEHARASAGHGALASRERNVHGQDSGFDGEFAARKTLLVKGELTGGRLPVSLVERSTRAVQGPHFLEQSWRSRSCWRWRGSSRRAVRARTVAPSRSRFIDGSSRH
jgi:hypothetical protein